MLKALEKKIRSLRDDKLIKPLMASRYIRKHVGEHQFTPPTNKDLVAAIIDVGDHYIAFDPNDLHSFRLREERGLSRDMTFRVFDTLPKRGGVFVDVGANIGTQTVYALKFGGFERAVCFEPHPKTAWLLRVNLAINGLTDRVTIIEAASGARQGTASLFISPESNEMHSLSNEMRALHTAERNTIDVPVVAVGEELAKLGVTDIGLAWIDVEGYEGEALRGWPSLPGTPLCIEYTPAATRLSNDTFRGWTQWAEVRRGEVQLRPIRELSMDAYENQLDLLFI
jgi:FkbM family methyltransferase